MALEPRKRSRKTVDYNLLNSHGIDWEPIDGMDTTSDPEVESGGDSGDDSWDVKNIYELKPNGLHSTKNTNSTTDKVKRKRKDMNVSEKLYALKLLKTGRSQKDIGRELGVAQSSLSRMVCNQKQIIAEAKIINPERQRRRFSKYVDIEKRLDQWKFTSNTFDVSHSAITRKAQQISLELGYVGFQPSSGFVSRWKKKRNLINPQHKQKCRSVTALQEPDATNSLPDDDMVDLNPQHEQKCPSVTASLKQEPDATNSRPDDVNAQHKQKCWNLNNPQHEQKCPSVTVSLKQEPDATNSLPDDVMVDLRQYHPDDIYTCSEFAFHHRAMPGRFGSLMSGDPQLSVLLSCNKSCSDKQKLLVVGSEETNRPLASQPCTYKTNTQAWISSDIFKEWLLNFDNDMLKENRKVVLVLCESPIHSSDMQFSLSNTKLQFLSPSAGLLNQPCGTGLGRILKFYYRKELVEHVLLRGNDYSPSLLDLLHMLSKSWLSVGSHTVHCCYWMAGFKPEIVPPDVAIDDIVSISTLTVKESNKFVDHDVGLQSHSMSCDGEILNSKDSGDKLVTRDFDFTDSAAVSCKDVMKSLSTIRQYMDSNGVHDFSTFYSLESRLVAHIHNAAGHS